MTDVSTESDLQIDTDNVPIQNTNLNESHVNVSYEDQFDEQNEHSLAQYCEIESKPQLPLPNIVLNDTDSLAVDDIFGDEDEQASEGNALNNTTSHISLNTNEETFIENGVLKVTRTFEDDLEMTYTYGQDTIPMPPQRFVMKMNDIISKNYPFDQNVSFTKTIKL